MALEAIFASKLYRASSRQSELKAAMNNPMNKELVTQLQSYLDPEYRKPKEKSNFVERSAEARQEAEENFLDAKTSGGGFGGAPHGSSATEDFSDPVSVENPDVSSEKSSDKPLEDESTNTNEAPEYANSSTRVSKSAVTADCCIDARGYATLVPALNARDDTKGATRYRIKDNELWVYYDDSVNLNTVMAPVIDYMNAASFNKAEFNRLARSDNAIVFELSEVSGNMTSISGDDNDKKES